jgi:hypothetical protein
MPLVDHISAEKNRNSGAIFALRRFSIAGVTFRMGCASSYHFAPLLSMAIGNSAFLFSPDVV